MTPHDKKEQVNGGGMQSCDDQRPSPYAERPLELLVCAFWSLLPPPEGYCTNFYANTLPLQRIRRRRPKGFTENFKRAYIQSLVCSLSAKTGRKITPKDITFDCVRCHVIKDLREIQRQIPSICAQVHQTENYMALFYNNLAFELARAFPHPYVDNACNIALRLMQKHFSE